MLQLTRYLYPKKFVELSFYDSMISKRNINECLYWIYELYYSGYENETIDLIYNCYFNFYALLNPSLIHRINNKIEDWSSEKDDLLIGTIVKHMYNKKFNMDIFLKRSLINNINRSKILKGPIPNWVKAYKPFHHEIRSIKEKNDEILMYKLKRMDPLKYNEFIKCVIKYFKNEEKINVRKPSYFLLEIDELHNFSLTYLVYLILFWRDYNHQNKNSILVALNRFQIDYIKQLKEFADPLYKVLKSERRYSISRDFIIKHGSPINDIDILNETRNNWKCHAKDTPYWKDKFISNTETDSEYDFEFDEQSLQCQLKSCLKNV
tara:strand:- start:1220 stop:2182 length:963 start_codon:yes stop_codon:yes gene_type:complete